jgi:hypothetical protein
MDKTIIFSIIPNILFLLALIYLIFSGLSTTKATNVEFNSFLIFFDALAKKDVLAGVIDFITFVFYEALLPLLPFFFLLALGFFLTFLFLKNIKFYFFIFQIVFLLLVLLYTKFSILILTSFLGILISSLILFKSTDKERKGFSFTNSLIFKHLNIVIFLIAIGLFLNSYFKFEIYKPIALDANIKFVQKIVPDVGNFSDQLKGMEIDLVNKTCEGIKGGIIESYQQFPQDVRENCERVHESSIFVVDTVKQEAMSKIKMWNITGGEEIQAITKLFPILEQSVKATPLILAISFYLLSRVEIFFIALFFGFIGFVLKPREKKQKAILKKA